MRKLLTPLYLSNQIIHRPVFLRCVFLLRRLIETTRPIQMTRRWTRLFGWGFFWELSCRTKGNWFRSLLKRAGAKKRLWEDLARVIRACQGMMVLLGDFNAVRFPEERRNSRFNPGIASDFNSFIDEMGLQEYCMRGFKFTFLAGKGKGHKMSKIDRFLVCQNFFNRWPAACF
ncbi:putative Endonuclease/exonuclease/phosphatase superfamily [Helianthus annuus]|nr:putative Endonuclease/exonuclease/phosphatase superfamily [Helianthus annuus]